MSESDSTAPYRPALLHPDVKDGFEEPSRSVDMPTSATDTKPSPGSYLEYEARLKDLRLLAPYTSALKEKLGDTCFVLQFKSKYSMDSVPNEFRSKENSLLWSIKMPGVTAWVTDRDPKTFYFPSEDQSSAFLTEIRGEKPSPSLNEVLETRDNLKKLLR